jgi:hypothetical protein
MLSVNQHRGLSELARSMNGVRDFDHDQDGYGEPVFSFPNETLRDEFLGYVPAQFDSAMVTEVIDIYRVKVSAR